MIDMEDARTRFLRHVPAGGRIVDDDDSGEAVPRLAIMAIRLDVLLAPASARARVRARHPRDAGCDRVAEPSRGFVLRLLRVHWLSLPLMWLTALSFIPLCWLLGGFTLHAITVASIAFYMITTLPHHLLGLKLPKPDMSPASAHSAD